jgi:hypothetical protein
LVDDEGEFRVGEIRRLVNYIDDLNDDGNVVLISASMTRWLTTEQRLHGSGMNEHRAVRFVCWRRWLPDGPLLKPLSVLGAESVNVLLSPRNRGVMIFPSKC